MKKLNKKGFTLIELLAVIVILAIILVIAIPSVLNIQKNAKQGTTQDEALLLVKSIEMCMAAEQKTANCGPSNLALYYEKAGNSAANAAGVSSSNNAFYYEFDNTNAESYTIKNFKFSSNGYVIDLGSTAQSTANLKTAISNETFSGQ